MKRGIFLIIIIIIILVLLFFPLINAANPPIIIYKTKANYNKLVPIGLSESSGRPGPGDVYYHEQLAYPTELNQGYLLDNRGIGPDSVFLNITYEEYSQLDRMPSSEEFTDMIIDYNPFLEIYDCGQRIRFSQNGFEELNAIIDQKGLNDNCDSLLDQSEPAPKTKQSYFIFISWIIPLAIFLIFIVIDIVLLRFSKKIKSKSLKISIILPLIFWIFCLIYWIVIQFSYKFILVGFGFYLMLFFVPIILISIGNSIFALAKVKEKSLPTISLIVNLFYFMVWIIFVVFFILRSYFLEA